MQLVNRKPLNQIAHRNDRAVCLPKVNNGMYNFRIIHILIHAGAVFVQQLLDDIGKFPSAVPFSP